jgi:UDP-glucose 4-epimerase
MTIGWRLVAAKSVIIGGASVRVLVTGGAGYIGSVTVEELVRAGHSVVVYDNLSKGHVQAVDERARLVQGDLSDTSRLTSVLGEFGVEAVMHFAAYSLVPESVREPEAYYRNNVVNTLSLLQAVLTKRVKRFVFSSSAAVYGEPDLIPITEDVSNRPTNPYGETKLAIERALAWYDSAYGLKYYSLRYFNAAGASDNRGEDHDPETHLIPIVLQVALGQRPHVELYGTDYPTSDGTCVRDYVHVVDLAQGHILALEARRRDSGIYNLGNGNGFSVKEVVDVAREVTQREIKVVERPRRPGDPATLVASSAKIQAELDWRPSYRSLRSIVETAWCWHKDHVEGYGDA